MGAKKNVTMDGSTDQVKIVAAMGEETTTETAEVATTEEQTAKKIKAPKASPRSKRYQAARSQVDRLRYYPLADALALVKKTSYASFDSSVSADLVLKDVDQQIKVSFPFSTGKTLKVAIVDEDLLKLIEAGKIDFDILLTAPQFMPRLARLARILGPKGLMPNPKNGTIVADPEKAKAELLGGKTTLKTERKAPLLHTTLGKLSLGEAKLVANLEALLTALDGRVLKCVVSSSMSPGIKVQL